MVPLGLSHSHIVSWIQDFTFISSNFQASALFGIRLTQVFDHLAACRAEFDLRLEVVGRCLEPQSGWWRPHSHIVLVTLDTSEVDSCIPRVQNFHHLANSLQFALENIFKMFSLPAVPSTMMRYTGCSQRNTRTSGTVLRSQAVPKRLQRTLQLFARGISRFSS